MKNLSLALTALTLAALLPAVAQENPSIKNAATLTPRTDPVAAPRVLPSEPVVKLEDWLATRMPAKDVPAFISGLSPEAKSALQRQATTETLAKKLAPQVQGKKVEVAALSIYGGKTNVSARLSPEGTWTVTGDAGNGQVRIEKTVVLIVDATSLTMNNSGIDPRNNQHRPMPAKASP